MLLYEAKLPIYALQKRDIRMESAALDLYLKKKFCEIKNHDLEEYVCSKTAHLPLCFSLSNALQSWIVDEILIATQLKDRALTIKLIIKLALFFFQTRNYASFYTTLTALDHSAVARLTKTWREVPFKYRTWFQGQGRLFLQEEHHKLLRLLTENENACFPPLVVLKRRYQNILEIYQKKQEGAGCNQQGKEADLGTMDTLSRQMSNLLRSLSIAQSQLSQKVSHLSLSQSSFFVNRMLVWQNQEKENVETNFLNRSLLLE